MSRRLEGKIAVITGSTYGIGKTTARLFAAEGAQVVVNGRSQEAGEEVVAEIVSAGGRAAFFQADVSQSNELRALIQFAIETLGGLDILVNNAFSGHSRSVLDTSEEEWDALMAVTLKAVYLGSRFAIPAMIKAGGGAIINISSVHGVIAGPHNAGYNAAKAGIINLTRQIAIDYGHNGIRVNAICPGWIVTDRSEKWLQKNPDPLFRAQFIYPLGRPGRTDEVAHVALFLASDESSFVTGETIVVDGGLTIQIQEGTAGAMEEYYRQKFAREWGVDLQVNAADEAAGSS